MGLIKAGIGAVSSTLADQWKEYFYCDALDSDVLVKRGQKKTSSRSSNRGNDNIITDGSGICVADGQCMIIVEDGKIVDASAEPGNYTFDSGSEPSLLGNGFDFKKTFATIGKRFSFAGDTGRDQRVYYFNTKELTGNKFGTPNPVPFRVVDSRVGLDVDVSIRCSGVYSYRISDPLLFYANVCGNVEKEFTRDMLESQLKTEFISALQPALAKLSDMELRPNQIISHNSDLEDAMNIALDDKWVNTRGLKIVSIALGSVTLPEEDQEMIKTLQRNAALRDPNMAAATLVGAQAQAMQDAAKNSAGAMNGFMGINMASSMGNNIQGLYNMNQQAQSTWTCSCGSKNTGKFCPNCGSPKPEGPWTCSCGTVNTGKFCPNCGNKKPE